MGAGAQQRGDKVIREQADHAVELTTAHADFRAERRRAEELSELLRGTEAELGRARAAYARRNAELQVVKDERNFYRAEAERLQGAVWQLGCTVRQLRKDFRNACLAQWLGRYSETESKP